MKKGRIFSESLISFVKQRKNLVLLLVIALGVVMVILPLFDFGGKGGGEDTDSETPEGYKLALEKELAELCSKVYGAGKCRVSVSLEGGWRSEYKGTLLVGKTPPKVAGITVLCEGAGSSEVRRELSQLLSALYGVGHNRICVLKLSS